jgi:hypothetical protein
MTQRHELRAAPFILDRPWHAIDDDTSPEVTGPVVLLCSDHVERKGQIHGREIHLDERMPEGVTVSHWRLP